MSRLGVRILVMKGLGCISRGLELHRNDVSPQSYHAIHSSQGIRKHAEPQYTVIFAHEIQRGAIFTLPQLRHFGDPRRFSSTNICQCTFPVNRIGTANSPPEKLFPFRSLRHNQMTRTLTSSGCEFQLNVAAALTTFRSPTQVFKTFVTKSVKPDTIKC